VFVDSKIGEITSPHNLHFFKKNNMMKVSVTKKKPSF